MKCPKCETEISAVYSIPKEQEFRYSITMKEDNLLHAETLGGSITAMRKLLCAIAKQTGQEVEVFVKHIDYGNPINIDFVILHKATKSKTPP